MCSSRDVQLSCSQGASSTIILEHSPVERIFYFTILSTIMMLRSSSSKKKQARVIRTARTKRSFVQQTDICRGNNPATARRVRKGVSAVVSPPFVRGSEVVVPFESEKEVDDGSAHGGGSNGGSGVGGWNMIEEDESAAGVEREDITEWEDIDIAGFLDDLEGDELEKGVVPPGASSTDTSKTYSRAASKVIDDFLKHLDSLEAFHDFTVRVENPFKFGSFGEGYMTVVPRIFVDLTGDVSYQKVRLANRVMCSWQDDYKMKKVGSKEGAGSNCPYYQPSSQNHMLRVFFAGMNKRFGWQLGLDDLSGFTGSLTAMLAKKYAERKAIWVSDVLILSILLNVELNLC